MRKLILSVLVCVCALLAANGELNSFVINKTSVVLYNGLPKFSDTTRIFKLIDENNGCEYWNGENTESAINDSLNSYREFAEMVENFCFNAQNFDSEDVEELKGYIRGKYQIAFDSTTVSLFLERMKDIRFADSTMMHDYALSLFAASLGVCYDSSDTYSNVKEVGWSKDEVVDLFRHAYKSAVDGNFIKHCIDLDNEKLVLNESVAMDSVMKANMRKDCSLNRILSRRFKYLNCSDERWNQALKFVDSLYMHLLNGSVDAVVQRESEFSDTIPVVWKADGCGCSLYKELNGNVYAIYPYWLAKEGGDTLDFSVVTRIAYYGVRADDRGVLKTPSDSRALSYFGKEGYSEFVNVAHKHNVKVDWIINKDEWGALANDSSKMNDFFDSLICEVDSLVSARNNSLFDRFVDKMTLSGKDMGLRGDGVTLWFKNYPTDAVNVDIFRKKFGALQNKLRASNEYAFVNLMMNLRDLTEKLNMRMDSTNVLEERGIYSYRFFWNLLVDSTGHKLPLKQLKHDQKNFLIVFNNEPVSHNKLAIYNDLNRQMRGDDRTAVLHAVVPMLWLDYRQWDQLEDDASYYNDAFYSLGVAPYGIKNDTTHQRDTLYKILLEKFEKEDASQKRQGLLASFFCTYRWAFRLLNTLVYVLVFALLICYFANCRLNAFFSKHLAMLVALVSIPPLLTTLILSNSDPVFMDFVGNVGRWGCFVVIILAVIAISLLQVYRSNDLPKRKKATGAASRTPKK